jgi:hypothetical protein
MWRRAALAGVVIAVGFFGSGCVQSPTVAGRPPTNIMVGVKPPPMPLHTTPTPWMRNEHFVTLTPTATPTPTPTLAPAPDPAS